MRRRTVVSLLAALVFLLGLPTAHAVVGPGSLNLNRTSVQAGQQFEAVGSCPTNADRISISYTSSTGTIDVDSRTAEGQNLSAVFDVPVVQAGRYLVSVECSNNSTATKSTASKPLTVSGANPAGWIAKVNDPIITGSVVRFSGRCVANGVVAVNAEAIIVDRAALPGRPPVRSSVEPGPNGAFTVSLSLPTPGGDFKMAAWCETASGQKLAWVEHNEAILYDSGFFDVPDSAFYAEAVQWAVGCDISQGTGPFLFSPDRWVTRVELIVLLHRLAGTPPSPAATPFTDLTGFGDEAIQWAYSTGVTHGITPTRFGPNVTLNRGQVVTLLWRYDGSKRPIINGSGRFGDVDAGSFYDYAVGWAVESLVTAGTTPRTFSADDLTTRGQVITFLARMSDFACPVPAPRPN